jgi:hypothetical protein
VSSYDSALAASLSATHAPAALDQFGNIAGGIVTVSKSLDSTKDFHADFQAETNCPGMKAEAATVCYIVVGFIASQPEPESAILTVGNPGNPNDKPFTIILSGTGATGIKLPAPSPSSNFLPLYRFVYPTYCLAGGSLIVEKCAKNAAIKAISALEQKVGRDFHRDTNTIENFYNATSGSQWAAFKQVNAVYNAAAGSSTVGSDLATLVFVPGFELAVAANVQTNAGASSATSTAAIPTLSSAQAAQAAQNLTNGGNLLVHATYPVYSINSSRYQLLGLARFRDGADIPNFAGTNTIISNPINHFGADTWWGWNVYALSSGGGSESGGSLFLNGSAGYSYSSHTFTQENGFGNHVQAVLGQVSGGIVFNGTISLGVQRNFGPSQTYIDSATSKQTTQNQFATWTLAISYAKKPTSSSSSTSKK